MKVTIKRAPTQDRGPPEELTVDILTTEQLSPKISKLANGALLCRDVPIARVGWMMYGPGEVPVTPGSGGMVYVERTADELFHPKVIGSAMASTVVDNHPSFDQYPEGVCPTSWRDLAKGFTTENVRRGTGADSDVLLADLIITDGALIKSVLEGKREVSLGYDADYRTVSPGVGLQTNILVNHIALVEKGRCGPRCAIGDQAPTINSQGTKMPKRVQLKDGALDAARQRAHDAQAEVDALENENEQDEQAVHVHIHNGPAADLPNTAKTADSDRLDAMEETIAEMSTTLRAIADKVTPARTADQLAADAAAQEAIDKAKLAPVVEDEDKDPVTGKTADSAALANSYADTLAKCEVLVPGFRMPTFDAALKRKATVDVMCQARRRCLGMAYATRDGQALIDGIGGTTGLDTEKMDCAQAAILFNAAAGVKAAQNNRAATGDGKGNQAAAAATTPKSGLADLSTLNKANADFWAKQQATFPAAA